MKLEVEIEEGDVLKFNDVWWEIDSLTEPFGQKVDMIPLNVGELRCLSKGDIQERIDFSGELHIVKEDYQEVIEY